MKEKNKMKEICQKYNIKPEDYYQNIIKSVSMNIDVYPGLIPRQKKSLEKELIFYHKNNNKTAYFENLNLYHKNQLKNIITYKTEEPEVNQILEGGFKSGYIYKVIGPLQTGKTTLINSLVRVNITNKDIKILYFSFIEDNVDYDLLEYAKSTPNANLTIVDNFLSFNELLLSEYFKNRGEKLKNYNIVIFDPFTIILNNKEMNIDFSLLNKFNEILNNLAWVNKICFIFINICYFHFCWISCISINMKCFIFSIFCRRLNNTFWYYQNDKKDIERLILRNYENLDILKNPPNTIRIYLYRMKKHNVVKYYMKVCSFNMKQTNNFSIKFFSL